MKREDQSKSEDEFSAINKLTLVFLKAILISKIENSAKVTAFCY